MKTLYYLLLSMRPLQWVKNLSIFVAIFFSGHLLIDYQFFPVLKGFLIFCILTSAIYLLNDFKDREKDKLHPGKKSRPIASGKLKPQVALVAYFILGIIGLIASYFLSEYFFSTAVIYFVLLSSYSLFFRNVIILDGMFVAFGFVLRVWAGAFIAAEPISSWLIICTVATALLISFGRRRCELTILKKKAAEYRETLSIYPEKLLDVIITTVTAFTLMSYALFTFFNPVNGISQAFTSLLPEYWIDSKWLMATIPVVIYGVLRYLYLIYEKDTAATPEQAIFRDLPLATSIALWIGMSFVFIYVL